ncbi:MAG: hypothetical protein Q9227_008515 [Pyrenula ochraceoflavens]
MTFGYNANVFEDVVEGRVVDHADSLLGGLLVKRTQDQIVEQGSAVMNHPNELAFPLAETHESICKYLTPQNSSYKQIADQIAALAEMAAIPTPLEQDRILDMRLEALRASPMVLYGMGGVGKSQIALQYAFNHCQQYDAVFWISCLSLSALKRDLNKAAETFKPMSLQSWLTATTKRWLLILDNLDDPKEEFVSWVPNRRSGSIIYTSRRTTLASLGQMIKIDPMDNDTATNLLLRASRGRTETANDYSDAQSLTRSLAGLPLAIQQCGSYIGASGQRICAYPSRLGPLMEKLELYGSEQSLDFLPDSKPILATWDISFDALLKENPGAADLLCILAFFDGSNIEEEILRRGFLPQRHWGRDGNVLEREMTGIVRTNERTARLRNIEIFELALQRLISYSLVFRKHDTASLYLHPVAHYWAAHRLRDNKQHWFRQTLRLVVFGYPHPDFASRYGQPISTSLILHKYRNHTQRLMDIRITLQPINSETIATLVRFILLTQLSDKYHVELVEALLGAIPERIDLWFLAIKHHLSFLRSKHEAQDPANDTFRDLSTLTYAGTTWTQQLKRLGYPLVVETNAAQDLSDDRSNSTSMIPQAPRGPNIDEVKNTPAMTTLVLPLLPRAMQKSLDYIPLISGIIGQIGEWKHFNPIPRPS